MDNLTTEQFLQAFMPYAVETERLTGMPRFYTLAMHITEQGRNSHPPGNMAFGIKPGPNWKGKRQLLRTWEVFSTPNVKWPHQILSVKPRPDGKFRYELFDEFRAYDSIKDSYLDHAAFLKGNRRYALAWHNVGNDMAFMQAVIAAGYATDPAKLTIMTQTMNWLKKKSSDYALHQQ
jgi:flagellum-specific peptidoglycan hydrolase FlgJ